MAGLAVASGAAAITYTLQALAKQGEHIVAQKTIRLSIGTEHIDDILADLEAGFAAVRNA